MLPLYILESAQINSFEFRSSTILTDQQLSEIHEICYMMILLAPINDELHQLHQQFYEKYESRMKKIHFNDVKNITALLTIGIFHSRPKVQFAASNSNNSFLTWNFKLITWNTYQLSTDSKYISELICIALRTMVKTNSLSRFLESIVHTMARSIIDNKFGDLYGSFCLYDWFHMNEKFLPGILK